MRISPIGFCKLWIFYIVTIVYFYSPLYAILLLVLILGGVVGLIAMKDVVLGRTGTCFLYNKADVTLEVNEVDTQVHMRKDCINGNISFCTC